MSGNIKDHFDRVDRSEPEEVIVHYVEKIRETEGAKGACLYVIKGNRKIGHHVWIPKSVHDDYEDGSLGVQRWFAEKEGLI